MTLKGLAARESCHLFLSGLTKTGTLLSALVHILFKAL